MAAMLLVLTPLAVLALHAFVDTQKAEWRQQNDVRDLVRMTPDDQKTVYLYYLVTRGDRILQLLVLVLQLGLVWHFSLMFLPQLQSLSEMVKKITKPLFSLVLIMLGIMFVFNYFLVALFGAYMPECSTIVDSVITLFAMALGGLEHWEKFYKVSPTGWIVLVGFFVVVVSRIMTRLAVALMVSHKREKDLYENHSYHQAWVRERRRLNGTKLEDINPADVGWDFSAGPDKPPKPPQELHGKSE